MPDKSRPLMQQSNKGEPALRRQYPSNNWGMTVEMEDALDELARETWAKEKMNYPGMPGVDEVARPPLRKPLPKRLFAWLAFWR